MEVKLRIVLMSHLSDIKVSQDDLNVRVEFIKWLLLKYPDTDTTINPEEEFKLFNTESNINLL